MKKCTLASVFLLCWLNSACYGFVVVPHAKYLPVAAVSSTQLAECCHDGNHHHHKKDDRSFWKRLGSRLNTVEAAGYREDEVLTAGLFGPIKKAHNPITYIVLLLMFGFKNSWCFRNPYYWFVVGFCVKWYRARYVFKIPVWDRQPNWNNIITSRDQEKDLKAFTCKKCGSVLFIAKTREFFFEGNTGIGGLGCFTCGAKGKDNFTNDREKILEDVADTDDYFEYERPLDFVSAAERRRLLKEAAGDEEKANEVLTQRSAREAGETTTEKKKNSKVVDAEIVEPATEEDEEYVEVAEAEESAKEEVKEEPSLSLGRSEKEAAKEERAKAPKEEGTEKVEKKKKKKKPKSKSPPDDDMDILGMDL
jgi:hypothetical protein